MTTEVIKIDADRWEAVMDAVLNSGTRALASDRHLVELLSDHVDAPVRATLRATAGGSGVLVKITIEGAQALMVAQTIHETADGGLDIDGDAEIAVTELGDLWSLLAAELPALPVLRAAASSDNSPTGVRLLLSDPVWMDEQANVLVQVEAWPGSSFGEGGPSEPVRQWVRWWSVLDDRLYDVRFRDGAGVAVERPAGSLAAEFQWALVGALDLRPALWRP
ncbi:MAG: hypothetical protein J0I14_08585 [Propionibacteriaceae bacterium]|jgi:hypothetical protein|nr:hypothetical protein [Propionibacteriaceae bacterium]